jgi:ABC-type multidrug transport system ATPase subunit
MIEITHLTKTYRGGVRALHDVTLTIGAGMFGLIGANGAGKTTLMRIIAGLLRPTSGRVNVFGHDLSSHSGRMASKALLGYLPQELGLYPHLSAWEFLDYMGILKGVTDARARHRQIEELLHTVRLEDVADRRLKTFSGGMQRRVGIAQALLGNPRLLIVDEPTAGLDPEERVRLRNLLAVLAADRTIILSTHIVEDITQSSRDLAVMRKGEIVFRGAPADLIERAQGHVWTIRSDGTRPDDTLTVVSTIQLAHGAVYRVVGTPAPHYAAEPTEPSLEDAYLWLMRNADTSSIALPA